MSDFTNLLTDAVHGDAPIREYGDVAPSIHVTTINEYAREPENLHAAGTIENAPAVYSRIGHNNADRVESVLSKLLDGYSVAYSSGLGAFHALLLLKVPKRLFIGGGYHGIHGVAHIAQRTGLEIHGFDKIEELAEKGDFVHLESPVNPTGIAFDLDDFGKRAHAKGAYFIVDATFAPPPLSHPFKHGADFILHSASKFLAGHSDVLAGVLVTKDESEAKALKADRAFIGTIIPPLESWLLLRSLKTYPLRLKQQSENANLVIDFLGANIGKLSKLTKVYSSNLQADDKFVAAQLPHGGSPTFAIEVKDEQTAKELPSKLKLFYHSTSLGSVHSLIEWRAITDKTVGKNLLRISIGIEDANDLIADLKQALE